MTRDAPDSGRLVRVGRMAALLATAAITVVACAEPAPRRVGGDGGLPAAPAAGGEATSAPAAAPAGGGAADLLTRATAAPVQGVQQDAGRAVETPAATVATARWGERGPEVDAASPWRPIAADGIHDRSSEAVGLLQEPRAAFRDLPRASSGNFVDWAAALRGGAIRPRARTGGGAEMEVLDLDIRLADTKTMPYVTFPHRIHTEWLACSNCHEWLFTAKAGANDISMTGIARGRACGLCHGKVAFPATECFRCHNGPRPQGQPVSSG